MTLLNAVTILYGIVMVGIAIALLYKSHKQFWSIFKAPVEEQLGMYKKGAIEDWHMLIFIGILMVPFQLEQEFSARGTVDLFKFAKDMLISLAILSIPDLCIWWKKRKKK